MSEVPFKPRIILMLEDIVLEKEDLFRQISIAKPRKKIKVFLKRLKKSFTVAITSKSTITNKLHQKTSVKTITSWLKKYKIPFDEVLDLENALPQYSLFVSERSISSRDKKLFSLLKEIREHMSWKGLK